MARPFDWADKIIRKSMADIVKKEPKGKRKDTLYVLKRKIKKIGGGDFFKRGK